MRYCLLLILFATAVFVSCSSDGDKANIAISGQSSSSDTIVGRMPGYKANSALHDFVYFVVNKKDTSKLRCYFNITQLNEVEISIYDDHDLTYRQVVNELQLILKEASKNIDLRHLSKIWDMPLIATGDLAIDITKQLPDHYLHGSINNSDVNKILLAGKMSDDLNSLLRPYGKKIQRYVVEKAGFIDSSIFLKYNRVEAARSEIPPKILDAQVWVVIEDYNN